MINHMIIYIYEFVKHLTYKVLKNFSPKYLIKNAVRTKNAFGRQTIYNFKF